MKFGKLFFCLTLCILVTGCQQGSRELIGIKILTDRENFNPLLESDVTGNLSVLGIYSNGKNEEITDGEIVFSAETKLASGDVQVIRIENNRIIPVEGGMGTVRAVNVKDGKTFIDERDIVVPPFYHEYHQTLVMKLWNKSHGKDHIPSCTFEETMEVFRKTDNLNRGIPKIIYLRG